MTAAAVSPHPRPRVTWVLRTALLALGAGLVTMASAGPLHAQPIAPAGGASASASVHGSSVTRAQAPTSADVAGAPVANPAHPFSAPGWSPLRASTKISCVKTNCADSTGADYHGYWAIDFVGQLGDPVHAAGAGIFHVGATQASCASSGQSDGVWGWVDHGGGLVSSYSHLDSIAVAEGQLVTPATMIGRMGHWGDTAPCTTNYLHFEVRVGGIKGTRVDPGTLRACTSYGAVVMPRSFNGATTFDALPRGAYWTPSATSGCVTDVWNHTAAKPALTVTRANASAILKWGTPPAGTSSVRVATMLYSPSVDAWNAPVYSTVAGTATGTTVPGLVNGRTYRVQVAFRNSYGYSAWSSAPTVIPATVPSVPVAPRFLTSPTPSYVHYGWYKSTDNGAAVTRYNTQVHCYRDGRWLGWTTRTTDPGTYYYNHMGLNGYTSCQVRVSATNAMGTSAWSPTSTITKRP